LLHCRVGDGRSFQWQSLKQSAESREWPFPDELAGGKARLKHRLCTKLVERIDAGDWNDIQFGFRHVFGWKDKDANVFVTFFMVVRC
jgi:hypothetical protein